MQNLDALAALPQWVAWREEDGRKVPYAPHSRARAKANDRKTWATRDRAQRRAMELLSNGQRGGIGLQLGPIVGDPDWCIGGVDLDSCRDRQTGEVQSWASGLVDRLGSYAEVSPSGTGIKAFFRYRADEVIAVKGAMKSEHGQVWQCGAGKHPPAIELHLSNRYFTVTGEALRGSILAHDVAELLGDPGELRAVPPAELLDIVNETGPAFAAGNVTASPGGTADSSGSAHGFRFMIGLRRVGVNLGEAIERILSDDGEAGEWANRTDRRQLERAWENAPEHDLDQWFDEEPEPPQRTSRLAFLSPADCAQAPPRGYVVKGFIAPGDIGCIFGAPGAGKSLLAPLLGYMVAQGSKAFGSRTRPGSVLYVAAEDAHGMRGRVTALRETYGDAPRFTLIEGVSDLLTAGSPDLTDLRAAVADRRPCLIFLDTLAMCFPGLEENTAEAMGRVVATARKLAETGAAVVLIHHDTKAEGTTPRGHSLLNGALDMALHVLPRDADGNIRGRLTKNRNGACDRDIAFRVGVVRLGIDEDGDAITAALAEPVNPLPHRARTTKSETAALAIFHKLTSRGAVTETEWRKACAASRAVSAADSAADRGRVVRRAVQGLAVKGLIEIGGEHVRQVKPEGKHEFD